jgi:predicted O-methyltransferase YrrM
MTSGPGWPLALTLVAIALVPTLALLPSYLRRKAERKQRNVFSPWPIQSVEVAEVDPAFKPGPFGPDVSTEVRFLGGADLVEIVGATSDVEAWILAVLAKRARVMFEFGTATGRTAYLWALNSPADATVVTLTLGPDDVARYQDASMDNERDRRFALQESQFTKFYYTGTPVAAKVRQHFGDSKTFDEREWAGECDLVFVDGSHARSYVESDSRKALNLVRPGGLILWHDYRGPRAVPGVYEELNVLSQTLPLRHVRGTSFVVYRKPSS